MKHLKNFNNLNEENTNSNINWDDLASKLCNEFHESIIDGGDENNPYDWWLQDVTVADIIDFFKKNITE